MNIQLASFVFSASTLLLLPACDTPSPSSSPAPKSQETKEADNQPNEQPDKRPAPERKDPKFAADVSPRDLKAVERSEFEQTLRWDFSGDRPLTYNVTQKAEANRPQRQDIEAKATITITPNDKGKASETKTATVVQKVTELNGETPAKPPSKEVTPAFYPDGSFDAEASPDATLLPLLLPTPEGPVALGDTSSTSLKFPLSMMGKHSWMKGTADLELSRLVTLENGDLGAELKVDYDISDLSEVERRGHWGQTYLRGTGILYFNVDEDRYERGTVAFVLQSDFRHSPMVKRGPMKKKDALLVQQALLEYEFRPTQ